MPGNSPKGVPAASNWRGCAIARNQEAGVVAGVDHFDLAQLGMEAQEDGGDIAAAGLFALAPVVLVHARGQLSRGAGR